MPTLKEAVNDVNNPIRDYLNPKSAITMGACAAMVLAFTTSLCGAFPVLPAALVALLLSVMFGAAQVMYIDDKLVAKFIYGTVCTLIIFNAARGGNLAITDATGGTVTVPPAVIEPAKPSNPVSSAGFSDLFVTPAYAGGETLTVLASTNSPSGKPRGKYYYWRNDTNGFPVYTNTSGHVHTNLDFKADKPIFRHWKWGSGK